MIERVIKEIGDSLEALNIKVVDVYFEKQDKENALCIVLDREEIITVDEVVEATKIINPIIDKMEEFKDISLLDIYAKPKGEVE